MVRDNNKSEFFLSNFLDDTKNSFIKTFIRENRYRAFLDGILCTLRITSLSIIFGTILGFILFLICYNTGNAINNFLKTIFWLLKRIPIIVLLMVFYYIIFSKLSVNSELVAIISFTIIFGSLVAELLINTIKNMDIGQSEAAYALGFDRQSTFFKILLPQAFPVMFPIYTNMIVELIRSTAIVGYVAVQDLTKVGDLVRSRTYDAFFPLIAVAIIYVILAEIIIFIVYKLKNANGFGKESKYLKGVKRND
jgi:polar amino acid transport system substrate-binding protein